MKKLSALLFMLLMIVSFNACDDDSGGGGGGSSTHVAMTYDLQFEVPTDYSGVDAEDVYIYSLNKSADPWTLDPVDSDSVTGGVQPFDGYPFDVTLGAGEYLEIILTGTAVDGITSIDEYDLQDELTTAQMYQTYGYRLVGADAFTSKSDSSPDLTWDLFRTGYLYEGLTPLDNPRAWFPPFGNPDYPDFEEPSGTDGGDWNGKYMMKQFTYVQLYRMIQIINNDIDSTKTYATLADYTNQKISYWNNAHDLLKENQAIPMSSILTTDINADIADKFFVVTAADGYVNNDTLDTDDLFNTYDWAAMQQAYIVTDIEDAGTADENPCSRGKIVFIDPTDNTQPYRSVKFVTTIEIVDAIP